MKKMLLLIIAFAFCNITYAQFGPLTTASNMQKIIDFDCLPCSDAWVRELYYKIWGVCASTSGGQSDLCNIKEWNNGHWDSYDNLKNIIRGKFTGSKANGNVYIFVRTDAVSIKVASAGHIGWAFELSDGSYFAGSTENPYKDKVDWPQAWKEAAYIPAGQDNGFWSQRFKNLLDVLDYMKRYRGYDRYKGISWQNPNLLAAKLRAEECQLKGFKGITNNCLDQTYYVLEGLGLSGMPWKVGWSATPNTWFDQWYSNIAGKSGTAL